MEENPKSKLLIRGIYNFFHATKSYINDFKFYFDTRRKFIFRKKKVSTYRVIDAEKVIVLSNRMMTFFFSGIFIIKRIFEFSV